MRPRTHIRWVVTESPDRSQVTVTREVYRGAERISAQVASPINEPFGLLTALEDAHEETFPTLL